MNKNQNLGMQYNISFYLPFFQIKHFKNRLVISIGNSHFKYRKCWGPANLRALWLRRMFDTFLSTSNIPLIQIWKASSLKHKLINVASLHSLSSFSYNFVKIRYLKISMFLHNFWVKWLTLMWNTLRLNQTNLVSQTTGIRFKSGHSWAFFLRLI